MHTEWKLLFPRKTWGMHVVILSRFTKNNAYKVFQEGYALMTTTEVVALITNEYVLNVTCSLMERQKPLFIDKKGEQVSDKELKKQITISCDIEDEVQFFPPCMFQLVQKLNRDNHLKFHDMN
jgi:DNA primase large subunit